LGIFFRGVAERLKRADLGAFVEEGRFLVGRAFIAKALRPW